MPRRSCIGWLCRWLHHVFVRLTPSIRHIISSSFWRQAPSVPFLAEAADSRWGPGTSDPPCKGSGSGRWHRGSYAVTCTASEFQRLLRCYRMSAIQLAGHPGITSIGSSRSGGMVTSGHPSCDLPAAWIPGKAARIPSTGQQEKSAAEHENVDGPNSRLRLPWLCMRGGNYHLIADSFRPTNERYTKRTSQ